MSSTVSNVSAARPKTAGCVYVGPVGGVLPTSVSAIIDTAFKDLGYLSEDGITNSMSLNSESVKAFGGDTVFTYMDGKEDTFTFKLIEALDPDVLALVYGSEHVTGELATGIAISVSSDQAESHAFVIDLVMRNDTAKRIVIPNASVTEIGEISYATNEPVGYELTITALPDASGNTHYEYIE